jgi:hypothetical protein
VDEIFRRILDDGFSEFAGLNIDASIPVPEHIVNEVIESTLRGNPNIKDCRVAIGEGNQVSMALITSLLPWTIKLKLKLNSVVELANSPQVRAKLENNILLRKLGSFLNALPEGVSLDGDQVVVNLGVFLPQEYGQLLDLLKSVEIRTVTGKVLLDIKVEVND